MSYLRRQAWAGAASLLMAAVLAISVSAQKKPQRQRKDQKDAADPRPRSR